MRYEIFKLAQQKIDNLGITPDEIRIGFHPAGYDYVEFTNESFYVVLEKTQVAADTYQLSVTKKEKIILG